MKKVVIVIEDGMIQNLFVNDPEIDIEIMDLDTDDEDLKEEYEEQIENLLNDPDFKQR